jgi:hypothetical protein
MTVGTHDIALGDLRQKSRSILEGSSSGPQREELGAGVPMVKVHGMAGQADPTVHAGNLAELTKPGGCRQLPASHALDLSTSIRGVVANIERMLIARLTHALV